MDDETPIEIDDVVVLLLGAPGSTPGHLDGITRLEKLVFLFERESELATLVTEDAGYRPYLYGPFSQKVYQAIDTLASAGLVVETTVASETNDDPVEVEAATGESGGPCYTARSFELSEDGWDYYASLLDELPPDAEHGLELFKAAFQPLPLRRLLRYVYERYPDYTSESVIRDEVLA